MTREEQIKNAAQEEMRSIANSTDYVDSAAYDGFVCGAEWADKHPALSEEEQVGMGGLGMLWQKKHLIDKACAWLEKNLIMVSVCDKIENHEFIYDDFRKAMEE